MLGYVEIRPTRAAEASSFENSRRVKIRQVRVRLEYIRAEQ